MEALQTVPMAAFEAQAARHNRVVVALVLGWLVSVICLSLALVCAISYSEDVMETTTEVSQDADNYGSNYFANGDLTNGSEANSSNNSQENN